MNEVILHQLDFPYRLTIYQDFVYWSDLDNDMLYRANKYTGEGRETLYENTGMEGSTILNVKVHDAAEQICK